MGRNLERLTKDANDYGSEFKEVKSDARDITESRSKTLEALDGIESLDEEVKEARDAALEGTKDDARTDFRDRIEARMSDLEQGVSETQEQVREAADSANANRGSLESIAGGSDYGVNEIRDAASTAEQMGREYSDVGNALERETEDARRDVEGHKREIDS